MLTARKNCKTLSDKIKEYIELCKEKGEFHRKQANYSLRWWNLFGIINVVLTASQALTMTIQAATGSDSVPIAITGGAFAALIAISGRIQLSFSFNCLSLEHHHLADDFDELVQKFTLLINDIEKEEYEEKDYEHCVNRYISVNEKTHLQAVTKLRLICCKK